MYTCEQGGDGGDVVLCKDTNRGHQVLSRLDTLLPRDNTLHSSLLRRRLTFSGQSPIKVMPKSQGPGMRDAILESNNHIATATHSRPHPAPSPGGRGKFAQARFARLSHAFSSPEGEGFQPSPMGTLKQEDGCQTKENEESHAVRGEREQHAGTDRRVPAHPLHRHRDENSDQRADQKV